MTTLARKQANKRYIAKIVDLVRVSKSVPCMDCEVPHPYYIMTFDHRPGEKKCFNISKAIRVHSLA
jgi:hypothetical protein